MKIKRIIEQDPLAPMTDLDKALIWRFKHFIVSSAQSLPKFLSATVGPPPGEGDAHIIARHVTHISHPASPAATR